MRCLLVFCLMLAAYFSTCQTSPVQIDDVPVSMVPTQPVAEIPSANTKNGNEFGNYLGFDMRNSSKGFALNKNGKQLMLIKNEHDNGMPGTMELRPLLGGKVKELIYTTRSGGNHCCIYNTIIDVSGESSRNIFDSRDYGVFGVSDQGALGVFDSDNDGIAEITQTNTYYMNNGCSMVNNPVIQLGFKYDPVQKKYLPMKQLTPYQAEDVEQAKQEIQTANEEIRNDRQPNYSPCEYEALHDRILLSYGFINEAKTGSEYVKQNYLALDYGKDSVKYNEKNSLKYAEMTIAEINKYLRKQKVYKLNSQR